MNLKVFNLKECFLTVAVIIFFLVFTYIICNLIFDAIETKNIEYENSHSYSETIIIEKYINQGSCSFYFCSSDDFVIVSVDESSGLTWTTKVDEVYYNSLSVGDVIEICVSHGVAKYYE